MTVIFNNFETNGTPYDEDSFLSSADMAAKIELHPLLPFDPVSDPMPIGQHWKIWKH